MPVELETRLTDMEAEVYARLDHAEADIHMLRDYHYAYADTLATKDYVDSQIYSNNVFDIVSVGKGIEDRIVLLERSLDAIKALLMELAEKDIVSSWEAVIGDCLS